MLSALILRIAESIWTPRGAVRRLLAREPSFQDGVTMVLAGVTLKLALVLVLERLFGRTLQEAFQDMMPPPPEPAEAAPEADLGSRVFLQIALLLAQFSAIVALAGSIGRRFGGRATAIQLAAVVGWWCFLDSFGDVIESAMFLASSPETAALTMVVVITLNLYLFYLLAAFLAEAHGFAAVFPVVVAMVIVSIGLGMILFAIASALGLTISAG